MPQYTKKENALFNAVQTHLKVLEERTQHLKQLIRQRKKKGEYNITEQRRLLNKIKSAKKSVADAGFI